MKRALRRVLPYWLSHGDQTCEGCGLRHTHSVQGRCVACDRPLCPFCVVAFEGEVFCSTCRPEEGES